MSAFLCAALLATSQTGSPVDQAALSQLITRCKEMHSWGLVVLRDGKTVCDYDFGKPPQCNLMSATKSVTSMAIGALLQDGRLKSVDLPVCSLFPSFKGGKREKITIRQLLEHTSGLEPYTSNFPGNRVAEALKAKVVSEPGEEFVYNNRGVDLLSGVVRKLAGLPLDEYVWQRIFRPLGIAHDDFYWMRDPDGNPHGCAELVLRPKHMARLGQLMLQKGVWNGKRLLSEEYVRNATRSTQISFRYNCGYGWLWWISQPYYGLAQENLDRLFAKSKFDAEQIEALKGLVGRHYPNVSWMGRDIIRVAGGTEKWVKAGAPDPLDDFSTDPHTPYDSDGFFAEGWGGQVILVLPSRGLVVVRTGGDGFFETKEPEIFEASDLYGLACALVPSPKASKSASMVRAPR